jgi:hypothetical protein
METSQNVIRSIGGIVAASALTFSDGSAAGSNQDAVKQPNATASCPAAPIIFGDQSASASGVESVIADDCKVDADIELETIFKGLANKWREETGGYSLTMRRYAHGSYQSILALEPKKEVVSLILLELRQRPDRWFEALKALTKANPARDAKTFNETVQLWIEWGKNEKYI